LLASIACIGVGVILMAWWSGLALLTAFLFAGLAEVTDRPTARSSTPSGPWPWTKAQDDRPAETARYELDNAA